jgi:Autographiviridae endonuclease VII
VSSPDPTTKRCTLCGVDKPLSAYGKQKGGRFGLHPRCKRCRRATERARYAANRDAILAQQKADPRRRARQRRYDRLKRYGVAPEVFEALVAGQDGQCGICERSIEPLCVDHDHATGEIRGLLCTACNIGVGHLGDDPARLRAAARYLDDPPALHR